MFWSRIRTETEMRIIIFYKMYKLFKQLNKSICLVATRYYLYIYIYTHRVFLGVYWVGLKGLKTNSKCFSAPKCFSLFTIHVNYLFGKHLLVRINFYQYFTITVFSIDMCLYTNNWLLYTRDIYIWHGN